MLVVLAAPRMRSKKCHELASSSRRAAPQGIGAHERFSSDVA
jgi:hypothetical protein